MLSDEENALFWAEEAHRRDAAWSDVNVGGVKCAAVVEWQKAIHEAAELHRQRPAACPHRTKARDYRRQ